MDPVGDARRDIALELHKLAQDFEASDAAAFTRMRLLCWVISAVVTVVLIVLLVAGGDWRYLGAFWLVLLGVTWGAYGLSMRRQREQTSKLRALAARWLGTAA
jgi:uncharacterized membrane protein